MNRVTDMDFVKAIICHPEIQPAVTDGEPTFPVHPSVYYLMPDDLAGVVCFMPINSITWNPHIGVLPEHRGRGTDIMREACEWMFKNTPCRKIVAHPPAFNKAMIRVFEKCGFEHEGVSPKSLMFYGEIHDRILMGRSA